MTRPASTAFGAQALTQPHQPSGRHDATDPCAGILAYATAYPEWHYVTDDQPTQRALHSLAQTGMIEVERHDEGWPVTRFRISL